MAEIKIKKKKPVWPWILIVLVILALLYFLFINNDEDMDDVSDNDIEMVTEDVDDELNDKDLDSDATRLSEVANTEILEFTAYISKEEMGIDHEYTNGALIKLIDATKAMANSLNVDINADLENARANATSIKKDPYKVDHADKIRNAGTIISDAIEKIQKEKFPGMKSSISELKREIEAIKPETKTLNQKEAVKSFFKKAENILINMKNT